MNFRRSERICYKTFKMKHTQKMVLIPEDKYNRMMSETRTPPVQFNDATTQTATTEQETPPPPDQEMKVESSPPLKQKVKVKTETPPPPGIPIKRTIRKKSRPKWIKFVQDTNGEL